MKLLGYPLGCQIWRNKVRIKNITAWINWNFNKGKHSIVLYLHDRDTQFMMRIPFGIVKKIIELREYYMYADSIVIDLKKASINFEELEKLAREKYKKKIYLDDLKVKKEDKKEDKKEESDDGW